jgi:hypothetical protein
MLYGGHINSSGKSKALSVMTVPGPPALLAPLYIPSIDPGATGMRLRVATHPWGSWSQPFPVWPLNHLLSTLCPVVYVQDADSSPHVACTPPDLALDSTVLSPAPGADYGAILWPDSGAVIAKDATSTSKRLYFAMSTLNPYHVILMTTTVTRTNVG